MAIRDEITGKNVLFIPMLSARSYETGLYNLLLDGNMARLVSMLKVAKPRHATILIPYNVINLDQIKAQLSNTGIHIVFCRCSAYGDNAAATRKNGVVFEDFLETYFDYWPKFDYVIVEPNTLAANDRFRSFFKDSKIIYWCVASVTSKGTPWFVKDYESIDKGIAAKIPTECVLQTQVEALGGLSYADEKGFYDPSIFDYETIFFPFRLSDKNYHANEFKRAAIKAAQICSRNFKVLYTDVNDSGLFYERPDLFVKVPSQKEVYLGMLKSRPIIPYLEDVNVLTHINIHEMLYYGCRIIMLENDVYKGQEGVSFIASISDLQDEIIRRIESGQ